MNALGQQIDALESEILDLHHLLDLLAAGVEDTPTSRAIHAVSHFALRLAERVDAISAQVIADTSAN